MTTGALNDKQVMIQIRSATPILATVKNVEPSLGVWIVAAGDLAGARVLDKIQKPAFFVPWASVAWIAVQSTF